MDVLALGLLALGLLFGLLGAGVWIFSVLMAVGAAVLLLGLGFPLDRVGNILKSILWRSASSWEIAAIPMFQLMGELIHRADLSARIFRGLPPSSSACRGGLCIPTSLAARSLPPSAALRPRPRRRSARSPSPRSRHAATTGRWPSVRSPGRAAWAC